MSEILPTLFVSIASYRDPQCQYTVQDLFAKATHPQRINVGICWQFDAEHDEDCFVAPSPYPAQTRQMHYLAGASKGGCWARERALSLLQDEDYVLQIDAHMRFVPGWDEMLLDMLRRCPTRRAVLSTMVAAYYLPDKLQDCSSFLPLTVVEKLSGGPEDLQPLHLAWRSLPKAQIPDTPPLSAFFVGNFMFAPSQTIRDVPYDPHIYFRGQELSYSARLWTHGYDIYQPDDIVIFHYWLHKSRDSGNAQDYKLINSRGLLARQRVWHVLGLEEAKDPQALVEIDAYGMGNVRPLAHFWDFAGVDLLRGMIEKKALKGEWIPYLPPA